MNILRLNTILNKLNQAWLSLSLNVQQNNMSELIKLTNENSGFLSLILFLAALLIGWMSGLFKAIRNRPVLIIRLIDGPTMISTFATGREFNGHASHKTAISLYLDICNTGSASTAIDRIEVAYHNHTLKYSFLWFWIKNQTVVLTDFMIPVGEKIKVYPFLTQGSILAPKQTDSFLEVGKKVNGIVYFEQEECWGGYKPRSINGLVELKVRLFDVFGGAHTKKFKIPEVTLDSAKTFNLNFGSTLESLRK